MGWLSPLAWIIWGLGLLTLLYLIGMSAITRRIHAMLRTSLALRQQNRTLVDVLTRANTDADDVNRFHALTLPPVSVPLLADEGYEHARPSCADQARAEPSQAPRAAAH